MAPWKMPWTHAGRRYACPFHCFPALPLRSSAALCRPTWMVHMTPPLLGPTPCTRGARVSAAAAALPTGKTLPPPAVRGRAGGAAPYAAAPARSPAARQRPHPLRRGFLPVPPFSRKGSFCARPPPLAVTRQALHHARLQVQPSRTRSPAAPACFASLAASIR
eukprot:366187-Chlamydomonas_euryale.AAC.2